MTQTAFGRGSGHFVAAAIAFVWGGLVAERAISGQAKNASDGVYTAAQADRGQKIFDSTCATCHETSQFTGNDFLANWGGKPLFELFDKVKTTMPEDNPGTLQPQQYADVIAYYLKLNEFAAGQTELKGDADGMKGITFDKKVSKGFEVLGVAGLRRFKAGLPDRVVEGAIGHLPGRS